MEKTVSTKEPDPPRSGPGALPATFDEHGQATLKGFQRGERWMVSAYGD